MTFAKKWPTDGIYFGGDRKEVKLPKFVLENLRKIRSYIFISVSYYTLVSYIRRREQKRTYQSGNPCI